MQDSQRHSGFFRMIDLGEMVGCLEDLVTYFAQPDEDLSNEDRQKFMRALTNRYVKRFYKYFFSARKFFFFREINVYLVN